MGVPLRYEGLPEPDEEVLPPTNGPKLPPALKVRGQRRAAVPAAALLLLLLLLLRRLLGVSVFLQLVADELPPPLPLVGVVLLVPFLVVLNVAVCRVVRLEDAERLTAAARRLGGAKLAVPLTSAESPVGCFFFFFLLREERGE